MPFVTGTLAAANQSVLLAKRRTDRGVIVTLSGTYSGLSILIEASVDGVRFSSLGSVNRTSFSLAGSGDLTGLSASRTLEINGSGFAAIRLTCQSIVSGSATVQVVTAELSRQTKMGGATAVPAILFAANLTAVDNYTPVAFSYVGDGEPLTYAWDFGDGGTSAEADPHHTYASAGSYSPSLTVTLSGGGPRSQSRPDYVTVTASAVPGPHRSVTDLVGPIPSYLSAEFLSHPGRLANLRSAQIPDDRGSIYHVAADGSDDTGDGTQAAPWATVAAANRVLTAPRWVTRPVNRQFSLADSAATRFGGRDFSVGGRLYYQGGGPVYIPMLMGKCANNFDADAGEWTLILLPDSTVYFICWTTGGVRREIGGSVFTQYDQWAYWSLTHSNATGVTEARIDGTVVLTHTAPAPIQSLAGTPTILGKWAGGGAAGSSKFGPHWVCYDRVLTPAELATLRGGGDPGLTWEQVPAAVRPAAPGNWWGFDEDGSVSVTSYANRATPSQPLAAVADPVPIAQFGPADTAVAAAPGGGPQGGADVAVRFRYGDAFVGGPLLSTRPAVSVGAYGDPLLGLPALDQRSVSLAGGGWAADTGTTYYQAAATELVLLWPAGEDSPPFSAPLTYQDTVAHVRSNVGSWCWDSGSGGRVYINTGAAPGGYVAVPWTGTPSSNVMAGDNIAIRNITLWGSGCSQPGKTSGYGVQMSISAVTNAAAVIENCAFWGSGYHSAGFIHGGDGAFATTVGNRMGYWTVRNEGADPGPNPDVGTPIVAFGGSGGGYLFYGDENYGGPLPDWTGRAPTAGGVTVGGDATFAHGGSPTDVPYYAGVSGHAIVATAHGCVARPPSVGGSVASPGSLDACDAYVIATDNRSDQIVTTVSVYPGAVGINLYDPVPAATGGEFCRDISVAGETYYLNCQYAYRPRNAFTGVTSFGGNGTGTVETWIGGSLQVDAGATAFSWVVSGAAMVSTDTVMQVTAAGSAVAGAGTLTASRVGAFGWTAVGTAPVQMVAPLAYGTAPPPGSPLLGAGTAAGTPLYDAAGRFRPDPPAIGPRE